MWCVEVWDNLHQLCWKVNDIKGSLEDSGLMASSSGQGRITYNWRQDSISWPTVNCYAYAGKVHFQKTWSVILTFEPMTLKMSSVSALTNMSMHSGDSEKMPPKVLIWQYVVSLWPWPLTFLPRNLIPSSLSTTAPNLKILWNSHERFIVYKILR